MICSYCHHNDGLHSEPTANGLADDGKVLSPHYKAGQCGQSHRVRLPTGTVWESCSCPGWYPGASAADLEAATLRAQGQRLAAGALFAPIDNGPMPAVAELPFALTAPVARRPNAKQGGLF